jgi:hypothetical protein
MLTPTLDLDATDLRCCPICGTPRTGVAQRNAQDVMLENARLKRELAEALARLAEREETP